MPIILIRGSGDIGSAVAQRLFLAGYTIALHDSPQPSATRRKMAFTDAIFDGSAILEGIEARRIDDLNQLKAALSEHVFIPVMISDFRMLLQFLNPQVLIDARMRKHLEPEKQISLAPVTIGLGPNFKAGKNVHLAIETERGENLGQVIRTGSARPLQGELVELEGHARDRYIYAPSDGLFLTKCQVGETVIQGQIIAHLGETALRAPLAGILRGLTHTGVPVTIGTKIVEIDPRGLQAQIIGIAERPARIAQGVMEALS